MHPKKLPDLSVQTFEHSDVFTDNNEFSIISAYYHDKSLDLPLYMHKHSFYEINIITNSNGYHYIEKQCIEAKLGSVYIIPPNIRHGYFTEDNNKFKIFTLILSTVFMEKYKKELENIEGYNTLFKIEPILRSSLKEAIFLKLNNNELHSFNKDFDEMTTLSSNRTTSNNIALIGKTLYLISKFCSLILKKHGEAFNNTDYSNDMNIDVLNIVKTMEYIQIHYDEKLTINNLATNANMSRSVFIKQFETYSKNTVNGYITEIRIDKACDFLENTNHSISRIAQDCGFFDSSHFSKTFSQMKKISPLSYRNSFKRTNLRHN